MTTTEAAMDAIIYVRVSTEEQANEGVSLAAQEAACRAYCAMRGMAVADLVVDAGVSAGKPLATRDGGSRVLGSVRAKRASAVVAYKLDRLFRDAADCLQVTGAWDKAGVSLHLVDLGGQSIDTSTAMGRFFLTVLAGAAEMERNLIRERTSSAMQHMRREHEYTGGQVPYGFTRDGGRLVPHQAEQRVVETARRLHSQGLSLRSIGWTLSANGMTPRRGGSWNPKTIRAMVAVAT